MEEEVKKYYRPITHQAYLYTNKLIDNPLTKEICEEFHVCPKGFHKYTSQNYMDVKVAAKVLPIIGGGVSLLVLLTGSYFWYTTGKTNNFELLLFWLSIFFTIWFVAYFFTMPKKEIILNRMDGTITFPGWYWKKNITMRFDDLKFGTTTGGSNFVGAYQLTLIRPDRVGSVELFPMGNISCYKDLSFITWYMDKNRPLPPGDTFDEFRDIDFERRKSEGFPKPLYRSYISTPEATPKQQKQREKYWVG